MLFRKSVLWLTIASLSLCLPALADDDSTPVRYDNHKIVRVHLKSWDQIEQIHGLGALLLSEAEGLGPVDYVVPPKSMEALAELGIHCNVLNDNIQEAIDANSWVYQEIDISGVADEQATVYLRWTMGTTDAGWRYCGWNIDDVQVWAGDPSGCPASLGGLNCDGVLNAFDIDPFVELLTGG